MLTAEELVQEAWVQMVGMRKVDVAEVVEDLVVLVVMVDIQVILDLPVVAEAGVMVVVAVVMVVVEEDMELTQMDHMLEVVEDIIVRQHLKVGAAVRLEEYNMRVVDTEQLLMGPEGFVLSSIMHKKKERALGPSLFKA